MIRYILFLLVAGSGVIFIIYQIVKFFFSISNPKSRVDKDRKYGLIKLRELADEIVPFDNSELSILSNKRHASLQRKTFHSEEFGHLDTIYKEHLVAYYFYDYLDERKLLLSETSDLDVELYKENNQTKVWTNGNLAFIIDSAGRLYDAQTKQVVGSITADANLSHHTISIKGETRAHLLNNENIDSEQPRAYPVIELVDQQEAVMIYALTLYNIFIR